MNHLYLLSDIDLMIYENYVAMIRTILNMQLIWSIW